MQKKIKNNKKVFRRISKNEISKASFENSFRMHPDKEINEQLQKIVDEINKAAYLKLKEALFKRNISLD
jgi:ribosome maturation protein Sdo1